MSDGVKVQAIQPRDADLAALFAGALDGHCLSVVGISNLGKSTVLRLMTDPQVQEKHIGGRRDDFLFVYVDFNQMLEMTEQAFCELVLRCSIDALRHDERATEVLRQVESAYTGLVAAPASSFDVPLRFAQAMAAIGDRLPQRVVFLFDELDGPIAEIEGRVFLNLRALKDKHNVGLTYVTATNRRLLQISQDGNVSEFGELFAHDTHYLSPLAEAEIAGFVRQFAAHHGVIFCDDDVEFARLWAGGHPGLLEGTCRVLAMISGKPARDLSQNAIIHRRTAEILIHDINVQAECRNIWNDLTAPEQEALLGLLRNDEAKEGPELDSVVAKSLVIQNGAERRLFARTFAEFLQRQQAVRRPARSGLQVDAESGEVWVNGDRAPTLTNLEYRLLLLLYGRLDKICTKYEVVEAVWGDEYIDEVDDARIEKLVSRVRQKIEPDVANPRYLLTVRGRGYKLVKG